MNRTLCLGLTAMLICLCSSLCVDRDARMALPRLRFNAYMTAAVPAQ